MHSIKDVANLAGVGVGTVSRVINNIGSVKPVTRNKVIEAIRELNYVPNQVARNFKMQRSYLVSLLLPSIFNQFFSELAYHIEDELDRNGYQLLLCNSGGKPEKELYYLEMLKQNKVAGIIGITYNDIEEYVNTDIPIVSIDRHFSKQITCVTSDNFEGGRIALKELVKAGANNVAFIGGATSINSETRNRKKGFIHEAEAMGIRYVVYEEPDPIADDIAFIKRFLKKYPEVNGVFAITDMLAAKYIEIAKRSGLRVPEDVKVIGYDGIQDHEYFHPVLSTIRQPVEQMARKAVRLLLKKIEGESVEHEDFIIAVEYWQGETT
ncbi:LacI family DNA-binding transcriptional regulator [Paenibacillus sp. 2TAB23]|uniref:LacI family DNA-binding transcriptional regulator n=1 Tax=Paenibacillus sp. 2TAB23 TaxID=3233004 RepID=UPI003F99290A